LAKKIEKRLNSTDKFLAKKTSKLNGKIAKAEAKGNIEKGNNLRTKSADINSRISANATTLSRLNAIRNDKTTAYTFNRLPAGSLEGSTNLGIEKNSSGEDQIAIVMNITGIPNSVHALIHGYQGGIEGSIKLIRDGAHFPGPSLFAQQVANAISEIEAYQAQYALDPNSMPSSSFGVRPQSINAIDAFYIGGLNNNDIPSKPYYPHIRNLTITISQRLRIF